MAVPPSRAYDYDEKVQCIYCGHTDCDEEIYSSDRKKRSPLVSVIVPEDTVDCGLGWAQMQIMSSVVTGQKRDHVHRQRNELRVDQ